jgi:hypothetical protein
MMTNCKKIATLLLALAVLMGMTAVSFADKEPVDNGPKSVNPLFERPGTGETIKDADLMTKDEEPEYDISDAAKAAPPKEATLTRQFPATAFLTESFEASVPPSGWGALVTNTFDPTFTWHQTSASVYDGFSSAQVLYDPGLNPQDEWLYTPVLDSLRQPPT